MDKMFKQEDVLNALQLTAMGVGGFLSREYAQENLPKLPEELQKMVITCTLSAQHTKKLMESPLGILQAMKELQEIEKKEAEVKKAEEEKATEGIPDDIKNQIQDLLGNILKGMS